MLQSAQDLMNFQVPMDDFSMARGFSVSSSGSLGSGTSQASSPRSSNASHGSRGSSAGNP